MSMRDLDPGIRDAIRHFWQTRQQQSTRQGEEDDRDRGGRSAVTGGKQMDGFVRLVRDLLIAAGVPESCIAIDKRVELPGWFRAEKKWDRTRDYDRAFNEVQRRHGAVFPARSAAPRRA